MTTSTAKPPRGTPGENPSAGVRTRTVVAVGPLLPPRPVERERERVLSNALGTSKSFTLSSRERATNALCWLDKNTGARLPKHASKQERKFACGRGGARGGTTLSWLGKRRESLCTRAFALKVGRFELPWHVHFRAAGAAGARRVSDLADIAAACQIAQTVSCCWACYGRPVARFFRIDVWLAAIAH